MMKGLARVACCDEFKRNAKDCNVDSDDFVEDGECGDDIFASDNLSSNKFFGVRGPKSASVLEPLDCIKLIRLARDIPRVERSVDASRWDFLNGLREEAVFVPSAMFDALVVAFDDWQQLSRVLQLDWVENWRSWHDIERKLNACMDAEMKKSLCADAVKEFSNACIQNAANEEFLSDDDRKKTVSFTRL